tara:strand:+ start:487 stop:825 length:339 start_codon:yes stop_codon:yes gene_type:complete
MSSFYLFTGVAHFTNPQFFLDVMPAFMPSHQLLVDLSGYAEIILALALLTGFLRKIAAYLIILMLTSFFLVHLDMIFTYEVLDNYYLNKLLLLTRIPLQLGLIYWAYQYCKD